MKNNTQRLKRTLLKLDIFGEPVGFSVDGDGSHKSYLGLLLSLCVIGTISPYSISKFNTLVEFGDTRVSDDLEPSGIDLSDRTKIENLTFAMGLSNFLTS